LPKVAQAELWRRMLERKS